MISRAAGELDVKITIVNLNLGADDLQGCHGIAKALGTLGVLRVTILHFQELRRPPLPVELGDALVLGPQGTPFAAYDSDFLPWLRGFAKAWGGPILGICGGMQALTLALGGSLGCVDGSDQAQGDHYGDRSKISGPHEVLLTPTGWPPWLLRSAPQLARDWQAAGSRAWENHVEQPTGIPEDLQVLAHSPTTPIEAWAHRSRPWLASQFHPERGWRANEDDTSCGAGKVWLEAWLQVVRDWRAAKVGS